MLSYLHGFHAGNAADVLKHSVLIFCLSYLKRKEKPLLCVDTHAGAGFYDLGETGATGTAETAGQPNREWERGMGRLLKTGGKRPPMVDAYVASCAPAAAKGRLSYPGSPVIMARGLTKGDRLVCFELHPREFESLKASITELRGEGEAGPTSEVRREDGPGGLKSLLPPPSRRGLVLIDPSWEEHREYESIPRAVMEGLRRFPEGTFIIWYPLLALPKEKAAPQPALQDILYGLSDGKRCRAELLLETCAGGTVNSPRGMYGCGLVVYNPPWTLQPALEETLPYLAKVLGGEEGSWRLEYVDK